MFEKKQTGEGSRDDKDTTSEPEQREAGEERARGGRHKRARGGHMPEALMKHDEEEKKKDEKEKHRPAHHPRKRGGHVPGHKSAHRPDKRARGGGADLDPLSSAGNMSGMDYEKGKRTNEDEEGAARGPDRNAKGFA